MSNILLTRPRNLRIRNNARSNRTASSPMVRAVLVSPRQAVPLCRVAVIAIAVAASSCSLANLETADGNAISGDRLDSACDLQDESGDGQPNAIEREILALVNRERQSAGVGQLCFSRGLATAARQHNSKMASEGLFDHRVEGEGCLLDRVTFAGVSADEVAENLFSGSQPASDELAHQCVTMWMQSDGHRRNMLSPDFDKTGISVSYSPRSGCYVTEDFAHATRIDRRMALKKDPKQVRISRHSRRAPTKAVSGGVARVSSSGSGYSLNRNKGRVILISARKRQFSREPRDPLASMIIVEN